MEVYAVDESKLSDNNLSQIDNELEASVHTTGASADEVFESTSTPDSKNTATGIPLRHKVIRMDHMTFGGPMERPRSFSDASLSSSTRQGILKRLHGKLMPDYKTTMKVFVKRETKVLPSRNDVNDKLDNPLGLDAEFGFHAEHYRDSGAYSSVDNLLDSKAVTVDRDAPPKPLLPQNYRKHLNEQLKLFHQHHGKTINFDDDEILDAPQNLKAAYFDKLERRDNDYNVQQSGKKGGTQLRRGRSSVSDLPVRSTGPVYKHFDAQFQSQLLKKELEKLRKMKHVRKNSETMKQKFGSVQRPKSTGDLHVRFADEVEEIGKIETPKDTKAPSQPPLVHPKSTDNYSSSTLKQKYFDKSKSIDSAGAFPPSGASVKNNSENVPKDTNAVGTVGHEPRSATKGFGQYRSRSATALQRRREGDQRGGKDWDTVESSQGSQLSKSVSNLRRKHDTIRKYNYGLVEQKREHVRERFMKEKKNRVESLSPDDASINLEREMQVAQERLMMLQGNQKDGKTVSDNRSDEEKYAALSRSRIVHSKSSSLDSKEVEEKSNQVLDKMKHDRMRLTFQDSNQSAQKLRKTAYVKPHVNTSVDINKGRLVYDDFQRKVPDTYSDVYKGQRQTDLVDVDRKYTKGVTSAPKDVPNVSNYKDDRNVQIGYKDQRTDRSQNPKYTSAVPTKLGDNILQNKGNIDTNKMMVQNRENVTVGKQISQDSGIAERHKTKSEQMQKKPSQDHGGVLKQEVNSQTGKVVLRQCRVGSDVVFGLVAVQEPQKKVGYLVSSRSLSDFAHL